VVNGQKQYKAAKETLDQYVNTHGLRPSKVRDMVLEQICTLKQPFVAEQLVEACAEERISVGTVYNALNLFVLAQILHVTERQRGRAAMEYELVRDNAPHMYIICDKCGRKTEFHDIAIERLLQERKYTNFNMQHISLFVYGECKSCRRLKK